MTTSSKLLTRQCRITEWLYDWDSALSDSELGINELLGYEEGAFTHTMEFWSSGKYKEGFVDYLRECYSKDPKVVPDPTEFWIDGERVFTEPGKLVGFTPKGHSLILSSTIPGLVYATRKECGELLSFRLPKTKDEFQIEEEVIAAAKKQFKAEEEVGLFDDEEDRVESYEEEFEEEFDEDSVAEVEWC